MKFIVSGEIKMNRDLTVGPPARVLFRFCLPLFGSIIFQQLYNLADSLIAGKLIGENALAAVGNSYEITLIFLAFAFGCNIGCSVIVSKLFGAKKYKDMKTAVSTALISTAILCGILMLAGLLLGRTLLGLIQTPAEIMRDSELYLDIYIWGLPFVFFYNISTGIFSALGDSKTPFYFLAASSTANIGMDILFVHSFQMGVAGVAWATFLCQGVSCVLALWFVFRRLKGIQTDEKSKLFSKELLVETSKIAIPSILQQSFISVGNIIIQGLVNGFGPSAIAGFSAATKLNGVAMTSFTTIGNGVSNYTAQNLGAQKPERVQKGFGAGIKMVLCMSLPLVLLYMLCGDLLVSLFMNHPTETAIQTGMQFLRIVAPFYFLISSKLIADGILRGAGKMTSFMICTFTDLALRVILAAIVCTPFGLTGIWCAWPVGWIVSTVMSIFFYRRLSKNTFSKQA